MNNLKSIIDKKTINNFVNNVYPQICEGNKYIPSVLKEVPRLLVLGDIHGDYKVFIQMLRIGNVIDVDQRGNIVWTGGDTYVVQVGDQIDRCRPVGNSTCSQKSTTYEDEASDVKIMKLANELHLQAVKVGGAFISLLGNHEIMNASGIMSYVSYLGLREFDNYVDPVTKQVIKKGEDGRVHAFAPGNELGKMMGCTRLPAVIVGSHLFVHAGIINGLIREIGLNNVDDLETINVSIRMWLLGLLKKKYIGKIIEGSQTSMFWTRILGNIPPNVEYTNPTCINSIGKVLELFRVDSIIVGHTPQSFTYSDDINQTCSGRIWRVDNGSSNAFSRFDHDLMSLGKVRHSRRVQILEIINDNEYYILDGIQRKKVSYK